MRRIVLSALAIAAALAIAQPTLYAKEGVTKKSGQKQEIHKHGGKKGCDMRGMGPGGPVFGDPAMMQKELGLTDEQVKKIGAINLEHRKKMLDLREKIAPKEIQLERLLLEDTVDFAKVRALLKEISDIKIDLHMLKIEHRIDIEKVLTPDQKAKMKMYRKHMVKMRGPHHEGPPDRD
jgi:Spy/CpxP family protein refolding chaperone